MKNFFSYKRLGASMTIFIVTGFSIFGVVTAVTETPHGPGSLAAGIVIMSIMLVSFAIAFPVIRFLIGRYAFGETAGAAIGYAFLDLVLFSVIFVAGVYGFLLAEEGWQNRFSERAAEEIVYEATIMQDKSHCRQIPVTQQSYKDACFAIFANDRDICQKALNSSECRQNMILAKSVTPECDSESDKGCGYDADKAIWARAIRDKEKSMCQQITRDNFRDRCRKSLEKMRKLYSGTVKECTQTAQEIGAESGSYYECVVGTAMYQNKSEQCRKVTKENIYPRLSGDLKQLDYYQKDRLYQKLRKTCRQQLTKEIDIEYGKGYTATSKAQEFYDISERVNALFSSVVYGG